MPHYRAPLGLSTIYALLALQDLPHNERLDMDHQVIPDAAVEAAEAAVKAAMKMHGAGGYLDGYQQITRAAVLAIRPHLRAAISAEYDRGFDDGHRAGIEEGEAE